MSAAAGAAGAIVSYLRQGRGTRSQAQALYLAQEEQELIARGVEPDVAHVVARAELDRLIRRASA